MLLFEGTCILRLWISKAVEYFKWSLIGHTIRSKEDSGTMVDLNWKGMSQEVSENKNCFMLPRNCY